MFILRNYRILTGGTTDPTKQVRSGKSPGGSDG